MSDTVKARPFTIDELRAYLIEVFPEFWGSGDLRLEDIAPMSATLRLAYHPKHLRPGGTISGPTMFGVCDAALYVAILNEIGPIALLSPPAPRSISSASRRPSISSARRG
jgi:acyl-coenzyme A thioesterase PaaI-like protein